MPAFRRSVAWFGSFCCALLALVTLASDVHSEASFETPVAGSRLVPLFLSAEDGSREFAGWFDTSRNERCAFAVSGDGLLRCLPIDDVLHGDVYGDATCSEVLVEVPKCVGARSYALRIETPACASAPRRHFHALGRPLTRPELFQRMGASCVKILRNEASTYTTLGPEIAPPSFVAARYTTGRATLALKTEY